MGLVAYSIYKQNKHDFLVAFSKTKGREPNEAEMAAYTMGESTPRALRSTGILPRPRSTGAARTRPPFPAARKKAPVKDSGSLNTKLLGVAVALLLVTLAYLVAKLDCRAPV